MKGVDAIGPMLEPTPQAAEGPAKTKDGKPFDAVLAEAVEQEAPGKGKASALVSRGEDGKVTLQKAGIKGARELSAAPRSIHSAIAAPEATPDAVTGLELADVELEEVEARDALEEPKTPQQDQLVLAQIATVVARIVAPPKEAPVATPKAELAATETKAAAQGPALLAPPPANTVVPPARAQEFRDALNTADLLPIGETIHEAQTLRPGAGESIAPAKGQDMPRGPLGRALSALTGEDAPIRAAADKVMNAFRALSGRDSAPTATPTVPATPGAMMDAPTLVPGPANEQAAGSAVALTPALTPPVTKARQAVPSGSLAIPPPAPPPGSPPELAANPLTGTPLDAQSFVRTRATPEMPTVRPGAEPTVTIVSPSSGPLQTQPTQVLPTQPTQVQPTQVQSTQAQSTQVQTAQEPLTQELTAQPAQPPSAQPERPLGQSVVAAQPANTNAVATQPAEVELQQAVSEEVAREQPSGEKSETGEGSRERVHGFSRGGWTEQARSAYGGRGHEGGERGGSERGETARTLKREEERVAERGSDGVPPFVPELAQLQEQLGIQSPQQAPEVRPQNVPQNQPAPAAPVQELPDIVFQGRPDPTAANENATISLHHPDLGPIQLEVHREQGRVEVHAVIESSHAQAVLRANESGIRQGVQQAGMTFNALRVRVRGEEQPNNRPGQERRRRSNQRET
jgi:hypothetical protein